MILVRRIDSEETRNQCFSSPSISFCVVGDVLGSPEMVLLFQVVASSEGKHRADCMCKYVRIYIYMYICIFISITKLAHVEDVEWVFQIAENLMWIDEIGETDRLCRQMRSIRVSLDWDWIGSTTKANSIDESLYHCWSVLLFGRHALCAFHRVEGQRCYLHIPTGKTRLESFLFVKDPALISYRSFNGDLNAVLSCWSTTTWLILIVLLQTGRIS